MECDEVSPGFPMGLSLYEDEISCKIHMETYGHRACHPRDDRDRNEKNLYKKFFVYCRYDVAFTPYLGDPDRL